MALIVGTFLLVIAAAISTSSIPTQAWSRFSASIATGPPSVEGPPSLGRRDLLAREPEPFLCPTTSPDTNYFYSPAMRRLAIASPYWSLFACGEHPAQMKLDISALNNDPPGAAGVFWGLHQERNDQGHHTWHCLLVVVRPNEARLGETVARLYQFRGYIGSNSISTDNFGETPLDIDLTGPLRLEVDVAWGKLRGVRIDSTPIKLPIHPRAKVDWQAFASGKCGLIAYKQQVSFTSAFLTVEE